MNETYEGSEDKAHVLVCDDDANIRKVMLFALEQHGFSVHLCSGPDEVLPALAARTPDVIVLDIMLKSQRDGLDVCKQLRDELKLQTPILFVSSKSDEFDRVLGLETGADDYVCKPFGTREFVARVAALHRRASKASQATSAQRERFRVGQIELIVSDHSCLANGRDMGLTVMEFELMRAFLASPGRVFSRAHLVETIRGDDYHVSARTVDSHIRRIRKKLKEEQVVSPQIETVYGVGYRLRD